MFKILRQSLATMLYVMIDFMSVTLQLLMIGLPIMLVYMSSEILDIDKEAKMIMFVLGFLGMFLMYELIQKNGKKIDSKFREKTKKFITIIGGKDFLV